MHADDQHPVDISIQKKSTNKYKLSVSVPDGFGIQKEAPNRILLSGKDDLKIVKANMKFTGPTNPKKKEYFLKVKAMDFSTNKSGTVLINAKIYYCDYTKNICIPANIQKETKLD